MIQTKLQFDKCIFPAANKLTSNGLWYIDMKSKKKYKPFYEKINLTNIYNFDI